MNAAPPRVAAWLLRHFGCSPNNDAVIGDLDERYRGGRSAVWYWRHVFTAVGESFISEIRLHKLLAFRTLLIGNAFRIVSSFLLDAITQYFARHRHAWEESNLLLTSFILLFILCGTNARLVAWLDRSHARAMVFLFAASQFVAGPLSWIFEFSSRLNILLWNTYGLTALDRVCSVCTTPSWYGRLLFPASALVTTVCLLAGSGVVTGNSTHSGARPEHAPL
jgi:hypothetical protein